MEHFEPIKSQSSVWVCNNNQFNILKFRLPGLNHDSVTVAAHQTNSVLLGKVNTFVGFIFTLISINETVSYFELGVLPEIPMAPTVRE